VWRSFTALRKTVKGKYNGAWPEKSLMLAKLIWPSARVHFLACHSERSEESQQHNRQSSSMKLIFGEKTHEILHCVQEDN
jgi:hypothetical protein